MGEQGLQQFGGGWTQRKLKVLAQYLKAYATALSRQEFKRVYIDAFAGTGYIEQRRNACGDLALVFSDDDDLMQPEPQ